MCALIACRFAAEKTLHPRRRGRSGNAGHHLISKAAGGGQSATDPGQALLEKGESELDAQRYVSPDSCSEHGERGDGWGAPSKSDPLLTMP